MGSFQCVNKNFAFLKYYGKQKRLKFNPANQSCSVYGNVKNYNTCPAIKIWEFDDDLCYVKVLHNGYHKKILQAHRRRAREIKSRLLYRHKSNWRCNYWLFTRKRNFLGKCVILFCRLYPVKRKALYAKKKAKAGNQQYEHSLEVVAALRSKLFSR